MPFAGNVRKLQWQHEWGKSRPVPKRRRRGLGSGTTGGRACEDAIRNTQYIMDYLHTHGSTASLATGRADGDDKHAGPGKQRAAERRGSAMRIEALQDAASSLDHGRG